eukprot:Colp12_sorted_trinity150504_noHs@26590
MKYKLYTIPVFEGRTRLAWTSHKDMYRLRCPLINRTQTSTYNKLTGETIDDNVHVFTVDTRYETHTHTHTHTHNTHTHTRTHAHNLLRIVCGGYCICCKSHCPEDGAV